VTVPDYVQRLIAEGTAESLDEAEKLSYGEPDIQKQIDAKRGPGDGGRTEPAPSR
jgi:hypothetical protein